MFGYDSRGALFFRGNSALTCVTSRITVATSVALIMRVSESISALDDPASTLMLNKNGCALRHRPTKITFDHAQ